MLYIQPMSRTATLPPIRIAPETKARLEAVQRLLRLSKLAQGEIDLLDLNLQIGRSRRLFHCA